MPTLRVNHTDIHFEESGDGDETLFFSHGLLWNTRLYDAQVEAFSSDYRCIAYDHRGQGKSEVPASPSIDMETLYVDACQIIEALDADPCHFVGLSMGGFVGQRVAARRPELLKSLTLLDTTAGPEPREHVPRYRLLSNIARFLGVSVVADQVHPLMFGETFLTDPSLARERDRCTEILEQNERSIYKAVNGVIFRPGIEREVTKIDVPTLILHGEEDRAISMSKAEELARLIPTATLEPIPKSGHSPTVENPDAVNTALSRFLEGLRGERG